MGVEQVGFELLPDTVQDALQGPAYVLGAGREEVAGAKGAELLTGIREKEAGAGVGVEDAAMFVSDEDGVGTFFEEDAEAPFLGLGDVASDALDADHLAICVAEAMGA